MARKPTKRDRLIDRARELYAGGAILREISRLLAVNVATVADWKRYDAERGRCWNKEREEAHSLRPERVLHALERRFARMAMQGAKPNDEEPDDYEKRLLDMVRIISACRKSAGELTHQLRAMEEFAGFCAEKLPPAELACVRGAVEQFLKHMREENR